MEDNAALGGYAHDRSSRLRARSNKRSGLSIGLFEGDGQTNETETIAVAGSIVHFGPGANPLGPVLVEATA